MSAPIVGTRSEARFEFDDFLTPDARADIQPELRPAERAEPASSATTLTATLDVVVSQEAQAKAEGTVQHGDTVARRRTELAILITGESP